MELFQNMEDNQMKSTLKAVMKDCLLQEDELQALYGVVKEQFLLSWNGRLGAKPTEARDGSSQYRLDYELFSHVFPQLLPWSCNELFVLRVFRVSSDHS